MVRFLSVSDLPRILPLVRQVQALPAEHEPKRFHLTASDRDFVDWYRAKLEEDNAFILGAESDGALLGYLLAFPQTRARTAFVTESHDLVLDQICVDARARRQGIGTGLIHAMEAEMARRGLSTWRVTHWMFNTASAALMDKAGATPRVLSRSKVIAPVR